MGVVHNMDRLYKAIFAAALVFLSIPLAAQTAQEVEGLLNESSVTWAAAARFILEASDTAVFSSSAEAFRFAAERNWLPRRALPDSPARLNGLSLLMLKSFDIEGGLMYSLTGSRHFAFRELKYLGIIPGSADPFNFVSGEDLLFMTGSLLSLRENETEAEEKPVRTATGDVSVKFIFALDNAGNNYANPQLIHVFAASGQQEIGPGALKFSAQFPFRMNVGGSDPDDPTIRLVPVYDMGGDDFFISVGYAYGIGPGILGFALEIWPKGWVSPVSAEEWTTFRFKAEYTDFDFDSVVLGFGIFYDYISNGKNQIGIDTPFGRYNNGERIMDYLAFWFRLDFSFGLGAYFRLGLNTAQMEAQTIAFIDLYYHIGEAVTVGIEVDGQKKFDPFSIKPYVNYNLNQNMSLGAFFTAVLGIPDKQFRFTPGFWFKYSL